MLKCWISNMPLDHFDRFDGNFGQMKELASKSIRYDLWICKQYLSYRYGISQINNSVPSDTVKCIDRKRQTHRCQIWKRMLHSGLFPLLILSDFRCSYRPPDRTGPMTSQRLFLPSMFEFIPSKVETVKRVVSGLSNIQSPLAFQLNQFTEHFVPFPCLRSIHGWSSWLAPNAARLRCAFGQFDKEKVWGHASAAVGQFQLLKTRWYHQDTTASWSRLSLFLRCSAC